MKIRAIHEDTPGITLKRHNHKKTYHVSAQDFDEFDQKYISDGIGFHFATNLEQIRDIASEIINRHYGDPNYNSPILYTVKLNISNPLRARDAMYWDENEIRTKDKRVNKAIHGEETSSDIPKIIERYGYDSIKYNNEYEGSGTAYIVWDVNRIQILDKQRITITDEGEIELV